MSADGDVGGSGSRWHPTSSRRGLLCALAGSAGLLAGCTSPLASGGPEPVVREHVRGRLTVTETTRQTVIGGQNRILVTVANGGHDATVDVALYWIPELGLDPSGRSDETLRDLGYERAATERVRVPGAESKTAQFERTQPDDAVGYYVRADNRTFGAVVANRGAAGPVRVTLVDTTDMADQTVVAERRITLASGERRAVTFTTTAEFESFRVDATTASER